MNSILQEIEKVCDKCPVRSECNPERRIKILSEREPIWIVVGGLQMHTGDCALRVRELRFNGRALDKSFLGPL